MWQAVTCATSQVCSGANVVAVAVVLSYDAFVQQTRDILELGPAREVSTSLADALVERSYCSQGPAKTFMTAVQSTTLKPESVRWSALSPSRRSGHDGDDQSSEVPRTLPLKINHCKNCPPTEPWSTLTWSTGISSSSLWCSSATSTTCSPSAVCTQEQRLVPVRPSIEAGQRTLPGPRRRNVRRGTNRMMPWPVHLVSTARTNDWPIVDDVPLARGHVPSCESDSCTGALPGSFPQQSAAIAPPHPPTQVWPPTGRWPSGRQAVPGWGWMVVHARGCKI